MHPSTDIKRLGAMRFVFACILAGGLSLILAFACGGACAGQAFAESYTTASVNPKNTVFSMSAKELKAYKRAVAACMDYTHQPNPIVVDMSDLGLTKKQALRVGYLLHGNGELFWINTYNDDSYGTKRFSLPCYYSDQEITKKRKQLNAVVEKALKRIGPGMTQATKVHMLHDYLCDRITYTTGYKDAYTGLVQRKGDCFSYSLAMDLLLRRCGFTTDMAFNESLDHVWNVVKVGSKWYHVDVGWDAGYCNRKLNDYFNWKGKHCHLFLLQSDYSMNRNTVDPTTGQYIKSHKGWTCHHACSSRTYDPASVRDAKGTFNKSCKAYKSIVRSFSKAGLRYKVIAYKKVRLSGVSSRKVQSAKAITVSATVSCKATAYSVCGIASGAFSNAQARVLRISTPKLTSASVKGSLSKSKVKKIILRDKAKKKATAYRKYFKKSNSGRSVSIV